MRYHYVIICTALIAALAITHRQSKNNVCKTFIDYYSNRDNNPNCYYNPDNDIQVHEIIQRHGYPVEVHHVTTLDGYILTLFRIPHGLKTNRTRRPICLQHGITLNAGSFLISGKKSLGFLLADAGYDVWLGNFRGSKYSKEHTHYSTDSKAYWNFSIHELGVYDLPAQINHIRTVTKQKIIYVGFSMGATAGYIYNSIHPDVADTSLELFVGLAPVVYLDNVIIINILAHLWKGVAGIVEYVTNGEFYPRPPLPKVIHRYICFPFPFQMNICQIIDMIMLGWNYTENDPESLPIHLSYNSDAASTKIVSHYAQIALSGKFRRYDYGEKTNTQLYGSVSPPKYNISQVNVDSYLIYTENDKVATKDNVQKLFETLSKGRSMCKIIKINSTVYSHVDIISGKNAADFVYFPLIDLLQARGI